ncbi:hypothetical protein HYPSUDRAFT_47328 [Hypholoma sublateritium FD-334 SS-4]|uniref:Histone H2A C-terminal domain-containing protein n=1 Tax=Hypholoma sublateritium (strain FD-334 SS-4) TaxID=945553 RepID=A0A0D2KPF0_HYPSF|nr:hypothetical protein HYPSUDRAFT_47328 [Hypholoma sublateritium FD-334 SS-4]
MTSSELVPFFSHYDADLLFLIRLQKLLGNVVISQGGVVPHIAPELLPTKSGKSKKDEAISQEL